MRTDNDHMTICMITPPSIFLLDERVFPSLGILKVAAVLEQAGHSVEMLDLSGISNFTEVVETYVKNTEVKIIAITSTTPQLPAVVKIVNTIKQFNHDIKIIIGGPHVTLTCSAVKLEKQRGVESRAHSALNMLESMFDVIVSGDGEKAIFEAVKPNSPKIIDADDNHGLYFMSNRSYESSPLPSRHLLDMKSYHYSIDGNNATSLISQLGCPFMCSFCGGRNSKSLRVVRKRSSDSIVNELKTLYDTYGYTGYMFYDDELNVNNNMIQLMNKISDLQNNMGVDFRLRGFIKSELFTDDQAKSLYDAGFRWILCGFESASPRILKNINKKATIDDNNRVMEIANKHNLKVKALMSIGHAGESEESVQSVHDWLINNRPDDFDCTIITTYPGTPYYDDSVYMKDNVWVYTSKNNGDRLYSYNIDFTETSGYYKGIPNGGYESFVFTDHLSSDQLVKMRDELEYDVRQKLNISYNLSSASQHEHSMGQNSLISDKVFRTTKTP